jgi:hypothetical protein
MIATVSRETAIQVVGALYILSAIVSMPVIFVWSLALPSMLSKPSAEVLSFLSIFTTVLTLILAAGVAGWGLLMLRSWARVVALGLNGLGAAPIIFEVVRQPLVMGGELMLAGAVLLGLAAVSALLLCADFAALRRAECAKTAG